MTNKSIRDGAVGPRIADGLRTAILRGDFPPGSRIRQEDVAARFGASRLPVRAALQMLNSEGLVTLIANSGARVSRLSLEGCEEIYQMRERIEPLLLSYSVPSLSPEALEQLGTIANRMEAETNFDAYLDLDRVFHMLTYSGATTIVLGDTVERLWNMTHHYRRAFIALPGNDSIRVLNDEHRMMVNAITAGDLEAAERVCQGHIRRTRLELERHSDVFQPFSNSQLTEPPRSHLEGRVTSK